MRLPDLHVPHLAMPHFGRHTHAPHAHEHHHHRPAYRAMNRIEGGIDLLIIALVVVLAAAMVYGLLTATGYPAYFDRWELVTPGR